MMGRVTRERMLMGMFIFRVTECSIISCGDGFKPLWIP